MTDALDGGATGRIRIASALAHLDAGKYKQAALKLTAMRSGLNLVEGGAVVDLG